MIGLIITLLVAVLAYLLLASLISPIVGIVAAILILLAGIPSCLLYTSPSPRDS